MEELTESRVQSSAKLFPAHTRLAMLPRISTDSILIEATSLGMHVRISDRRTLLAHSCSCFALHGFQGEPSEACPDRGSKQTPLGRFCHRSSIHRSQGSRCVLLLFLFSQFVGAYYECSHVCVASSQHKAHYLRAALIGSDSIRAMLIESYDVSVTPTSAFDNRLVVPLNVGVATTMRFRQNTFSAKH